LQPKEFAKKIKSRNLKIFDKSYQFVLFFCWSPTAPSFSLLKLILSKHEFCKPGGFQAAADVTLNQRVSKRKKGSNLGYNSLFFCFSTIFNVSY
jgi:hypothetical protein